MSAASVRGQPINLEGNLASSGSVVVMQQFGGYKTFPGKFHLQLPCHHCQFVIWHPPRNVIDELEILVEIMFRMVISFCERMDDTGNILLRGRRGCDLCLKAKVVHINLSRRVIRFVIVCKSFRHLPRAHLIELIHHVCTVWRTCPSRAFEQQCFSTHSPSFPHMIPQCVPHL